MIKRAGTIACAALSLALFYPGLAIAADNVTNNTTGGNTTSTETPATTHITGTLLITELNGTLHAGLSGTNIAPADLNKAIFHWYVSTDGTIWKSAPGETGATYTLPNSASGMSYKCTVTMPIDSAYDGSISSTPVKQPTWASLLWADQGRQYYLGDTITTTAVLGSEEECYYAIVLTENSSTPKLSPIPETKQEITLGDNGSGQPRVKTLWRYNVSNTSETGAAKVIDAGVINKNFNDFGSIESQQGKTRFNIQYPVMDVDAQGKYVWVIVYSDRNPEGYLFKTSSAGHTVQKVAKKTIDMKLTDTDKLVGSTITATASSPTGSLVKDYPNGNIKYSWDIRKGSSTTSELVARVAEENIAVESGTDVSQWAKANLSAATEASLSKTGSVQVKFPGDFTDKTLSTIYSIKSTDAEKQAFATALAKAEETATASGTSVSISDKAKLAYDSLAIKPFTKVDGVYYTIPASLCSLTTDPTGSFTVSSSLGQSASGSSNESGIAKTNISSWGTAKDESTITALNLAVSDPTRTTAVSVSVPVLLSSGTTDYTATTYNNSSYISILVNGEKVYFSTPTKVYRTEADGTKSQVETASSYTFTDADAGNYVFFSAKDELGLYGGYSAAAVGPIRNKTSVSTETDSNGPYLGSTISAHAYNNKESNLYYKWYVSDSDDEKFDLFKMAPYDTTAPMQILAPGDNTAKLLLNSETADGKKLWFVVFSSNASPSVGTLVSGTALEQKISKRTLPTPAFSGALYVGSTLTAAIPDNISEGFPSADISFEWMQSNLSNSDDPMPGGTGTSVKLTDEQLDKMVSLRLVDKANLYLPASSGAQGPIRNETGEVSLDINGDLLEGKTVGVVVRNIPYQKSKAMLVSSSAADLSASDIVDGSAKYTVIEGDKGFAGSSYSFPYKLSSSEVGKHLYIVVQNDNGGGAIEHTVSPASGLVSGLPKVTGDLNVGKTIVGSVETSACGGANDPADGKLYYAWIKKTSDGAASILSTGAMPSTQSDNGMRTATAQYVLKAEDEKAYIGFAVSCHPYEFKADNYTKAQNGYSFSLSQVKAEIPYDLSKMSTFYIDKGDIVISQSTATGYDASGSKLTVAANSNGYRIAQSSQAPANHSVSVEAGATAIVLLDGVNIDLVDQSTSGKQAISVGKDAVVKLYGVNGTKNILSTTVANNVGIFNSGTLYLSDGSLEVHKDASAGGSSGETEPVKEIDPYAIKVYALYTTDDRLVSCNAEGVADGKYEYSVTGSEDKKKHTITDIIIDPSVVNIRNYAFSGCYAVKSVTIPDKAELTVIGEHAFDSCYALESISIPDSIRTIKGYAFTDCRSLESVVIPKDVGTIEEGAFSKCSNLKSVVFQGDWKKRVATGAFSDTKLGQADDYAIYVENDLLQKQYREDTALLNLKSSVKIYGQGTKYTLTAADYDKYIRCVASETGVGSSVSPITSNIFGKIKG